jgi:hypothetical protein
MISARSQSHDAEEVEEEGWSFSDPCAIQVLEVPKRGRDEMTLTRRLKKGRMATSRCAWLTSSGAGMSFDRRSRSQHVIGSRGRSRLLRDEEEARLICLALGGTQILKKVVWRQSLTAPRGELTSASFTISSDEGSERNAC